VRQASWCDPAGVASLATRMARRWDRAHLGYWITEQADIELAKMML
jgi:hypothetical protein